MRQAEPESGVREASEDDRQTPRSDSRGDRAWALERVYQVDEYEDPVDDTSGVRVSFGGVVARVGDAVLEWVSAELLSIGPTPHAPILAGLHPRIPAVAIRPAEETADVAAFDQAVAVEGSNIPWGQVKADLDR